MSNQGKYFVTMNDSFMSGWGHAQGKINKLIFVCESLDEARTVANFARNRGDQKFIKIHEAAPNLYKPEKGSNYNHRHYYVQIKTKQTSSAWYN